MPKLPFQSMAGVLLLVAGSAEAGEARAEHLRAGIIGLDTSHVLAFTELLNAPHPKPELAGVRVVAAFPAGSPDISESANRLQKFTDTLRDQHQVEIVDSIPALLERVDVVLLESVDGRPHLEQVRAVIVAGKPVFIDKPVAASLADAIEIFELAGKHNVPCFSSSSLRFSPGVRGARSNDAVGEVVGCSTYGPCALQPQHPDLFWYGVHGVELLFTIMGPECESVSRVQTADTELVTGVWKDGRVGTYRGIRKGKSGFGALVFGSKGIEHVPCDPGYDPLVAEIVTFFKTGKAPVSAEETIRIFAFMEAADESKRQGGQTVTLKSVLEKAHQKIAERQTLKDAP